MPKALDEMSPKMGSTDGTSMQAPGVKDKEDADVITPAMVNKFHSKSDLDSSQTAQHHTCGIKRDQASPGDHNHNGVSSKQLLDNVSISGSRSDGSALNSVISALVQLGADDNTTP